MISLILFSNQVLSSYWNEPLDVENFTESVIFDATTGFGGDGKGPNRCVADGPFANLTLRFKEDLSTSAYCLSRNFNSCAFSSAAQSIVDHCLTVQSFEEVRVCLEGAPHGAGHGGVGAVVSSYETITFQVFFQCCS